MGAANDAQNVRVDTARGKDNDQQNLPKMIMWYRSIYYQTASDAWRYNNPVYKLMTDKPQLILINELLDQFLNITVSQGSVAMHLRCGGIFNNQYESENILKIGQHLPKL